MGDIMGSFPESVQVRTMLAEKTRVGLWGQSVIIKAVWGVIDCGTVVNFLCAFFTTRVQATGI
jgi:hypothetical protein